MPESDTTTENGGTERVSEPEVSEAVRSTESYEVSEGVVFYDTDDPLAWMQADHAVDLDDAA